MPRRGWRGTTRPQLTAEDAACELLLDKLASGAHINEQEHKQLVRYERRKYKRAYDARRRGQAGNGEGSSTRRQT